MMTLRLRRCVSLFVCLSLLLSACSPDKSSKAGNKVSSKASEFSRNTEVEKDSVEKIADHAPSAVNNNNVPPVSFWNRELGKVGGVSITTKRITYGLGTVIGGSILIFAGVKWYKLKKKEKELIEEVNILKERLMLNERHTYVDVDGEGEGEGEAA